MVHDAQSLLPQPGAVIGLLVISRLEDLVKTPQPLPYRARCEQKCARAVVHIPSEHVHRREWIVTAAITQAGAIPPNDASALLQCPVEQNQTAPHGADVRCAANR